MLNPKGLEALRAFMETGSITEAAARLRRTQPQVGRLLTALEAELGFPLFVRRHRRLIPTPEARDFYLHAERVLLGHDELVRRASQIQTGRSDHVRVLIAPEVTNALVLDAVATVARKSPAFTATINSSVRIDIDLWLGREQFDLGVTVLPLTAQGIEVEEFVSADAVAVIPADHKLAARSAIGLKDLLDEPLITTNPRSLLRQRFDQLLTGGSRRPVIRLETNNGLVACRLAGEGLGITIADPFIAWSSGSEGVVIRPFRPAITLRYAFLYPVWQSRSETTERLAAAISAVARERLRHARSLARSHDASGRSR